MIPGIVMGRESLKGKVVKSTLISNFLTSMNINSQDKEKHREGQKKLSKRQVTGCRARRATVLISLSSVIEAGQWPPAQAQELTDERFQGSLA
jgi:hypothetical protein